MDKRQQRALEGVSIVEPIAINVSGGGKRGIYEIPITPPTKLRGLRLARESGCGRPKQLTRVEKHISHILINNLVL